jgi:hypothetical protein
MWGMRSGVNDAGRMILVCDECGAMFDAADAAHDDRRKLWQLANIAGWARVSRTPERHLCASC